MSERIWRAAAAVADAAGTQLARARAAALAADAEAAGIAAAVDDDRVILRGPGLAARLFGTRRQPPDLRLAAMVTEGSRR